MAMTEMSCYLLIGEAPDPLAADRIATQYAGCPYVHFISAFSSMVVGVWYLPEAQRWWLKLVAEQPMLTLGLARAAVYRSEAPAYPASFELRTQGQAGETSPCGSDCRLCERSATCCHCPACRSYDLTRGEGME
jgi:hypothetical protein